MNVRNRDSCRPLFKNLKFLPLKSLFVTKNRDLYESISKIHNINARFSSDLYTPTSNFTTFQKDPFLFWNQSF
jgi:hypothetical protein